MRIDSNKFKSALTSEDKLSIYGEYHNMLEAVVQKVECNTKTMGKDEANSHIQLLSNIREAFSLLDEKLKDQNTDEVYNALHAVEELCKELH